MSDFTGAALSMGVLNIINNLVNKKSPAKTDNNQNQDQKADQTPKDAGIFTGISSCGSNGGCFGQGSSGSIFGQMMPMMMMQSSLGTYNNKDTNDYMDKLMSNMMMMKMYQSMMGNGNQQTNSLF